VRRIMMSTLEEKTTSIPQTDAVFMVHEEKNTNIYIYIENTMDV
jgi:hypothetical protein